AAARSHADLMLVSDAAGPSSAAVMERAGAENFPVASRVLPRRVRAHLLAVYGFARLVDELGDAASVDRRSAGSSASDRLDALDDVERDLDRAFEGRAEHPLLARLQATLRECALERGPFVRLIEANRTDQRVSRYETWEQLRAYCALSANPVGEIVLGVLGRATPERIALSDSICTALQLAEHLQDVAEDVAAGRFYIPAEDLARFGASHDDLSVLAAPARTTPVPPGVTKTIAFEVERARALLREGASLIDTLAGRERLAVAAFVAGGAAALEAIERAAYDVSRGAPRAGTARRLVALARVLADRRDARSGRPHAQRA
ncbi:MAG TPA: squalene synthase HpnC, partial [Solirubrobacteraceae bacterium]|nr:squalene synthase HpnC [Solirubrobacteraceae bacterium]